MGRNEEHAMVRFQLKAVLYRRGKCRVEDTCAGAACMAASEEGAGAVMDAAPSSVAGASSGASACSGARAGAG